METRTEGEGGTKMKNRLLVLTTEILLYALAAAVVCCLVLVFAWPAARVLFEEYYGAGDRLLLFDGFLVMAGLLALWVLIELIAVMHTVRGDPFIARNVSAFMRMGAAAEAAGVLFAVKCFVFFTPMTAVCAIVMLLAGLFALVLSGVFGKAVEYKRENDLTI